MRTSHGCEFISLSFVLNIYPLTDTPKQNTGTSCNPIPAPFYIGAICISNDQDKRPLCIPRAAQPRQVQRRLDRSCRRGDSRQAPAAHPGHGVTGWGAFSTSPPPRSKALNKAGRKQTPRAAGSVGSEAASDTRGVRGAGAWPGSRRAQRAADPGGGRPRGVVMPVKTPRLTAGEQDIKTHEIDFLCLFGSCCWNKSPQAVLSPRNQARGVRGSCSPG